MPPAPPEPTPPTAAEWQQLDAVDRDARVGRTLQQAAPVGAALIVGEWLLSFAGLDLAPLDADSVSIPVAVVASLGVLGTWMLSRRMNRAPQPPSPPDVDA